MGFPIHPLLYIFFSAANGIQAALLARERRRRRGTGTGSGEGSDGVGAGGSYVDIAMLDCSIAASMIPLGQWHATGKDPLPIGKYTSSSFLFTSSSFSFLLLFAY